MHRTDFCGELMNRNECAHLAALESDSVLNLEIPACQEPR